MGHAGMVGAMGSGVPPQVMWGQQNMGMMMQPGPGELTNTLYRPLSIATSRENSLAVFLFGSALCSLFCSARLCIEQRRGLPSRFMALVSSHCFLVLQVGSSSHRLPTVTCRCNLTSSTTSRRAAAGAVASSSRLSSTAAALPAAVRPKPWHLPAGPLYLLPQQQPTGKQARKQRRLHEAEEGFTTVPMTSLYCRRYDGQLVDLRFFWPKPPHNRYHPTCLVFNQSYKRIL